MKTVCVDLDGTLVVTDTLIEAILTLVKRNPLLVFSLLVWLLHGKAYFKSAIAARVELDPQQLVYNLPVIDRIKAYKAKGHPIYLVTAAHQRFAECISKAFNFFDGIIASNDTINLSGEKKAKICSQKFGKNNFIYFGNSSQDLPVWKDAETCICITQDKQLIKNCKQQSNNVVVIAKKMPTIKDYLKLVRIHHYAKNALVFLPLLLSKELSSATVWQHVLAFFAFCFVCSAIYIINDLYDLAADRQHKIKKRRAFASGLISIPHGLVLMLLCFAASVGIQLYLHNLYFSLIIIIYLILSTAYSVRFKEIIIFDVMILTVLYTIRILAGMVLLPDAISHWFLTFSIFFFLSLSYMKRYIEINKLDASTNAILRRGYNQQHEWFVKISGITTGFISIVIFILYVASEKAKLIYADVNLLYLIAFAILYWMQRIWLLAIEKKVNDDPIEFALKDKSSYIIAGIAAIFLILAHVRIM